jgi:F0F1-type ATP synthase membrane subunit b/b'
MADITSRIQLIIEAQNKAGTELAKLAVDMNRLNDKTKTAGLSMGSLIGYLGGATAAYFAIKNVIIGSVNAYEESEKAMKQTEAVLASTKGVSGQTAKSISDLAMKMQTMSTYSDEAVQSAENLLLTFTNITTNFPEATQAVVDMSVALGTDLNGAAIQVGKALQDPVLGVTALRRVGVNFTDSQREMLTQLVQTGHGMEAQKLILRELAIEFGGSAAKQLQTFGGRLEWTKNQVSELQEGLGMGLVNGLMLSTAGISVFLDNMMGLSKELETVQANYQKVLETGDTSKITAAGNAVLEVENRITIANDEMMQRVNKSKLDWANWGSTIVIESKLVAKLFWDACMLIANVLVGLVTTHQAAMKDISNGFLHPMTNMKAFASAFSKILRGDVMGAWEEMKKGVSGTSAAITTSVNGISAAWGQFGKDWESTSNELSQAFQDNEKLIMGVGEASKMATPPIKDFGEASSDMAKKVEDAKNKIRDLKKEMKEAVASAKQDIKDLKKEYKKTEVAAEKDLGKSIGEIIYNKQKDLADLKKQFNEANTAEQKNTLGAQILIIQDFLKAHLSEQQTYADEILAAQQFAAMDEIQKLQFKFAEEKKQRLADYKDQLKDLKKHLKDVEKEYKQKLKDLKRELIKELGNISIKIDINKSSKKALGGSVNSGQPYIVGEHRPEVFIPSQSGNIQQVGKMGTVNINFGGVTIAGEADENRLVDKIKRALRQDSSLGRMGIS